MKGKGADGLFLHIISSQTAHVKINIFNKKKYFCVPNKKELQGTKYKLRNSVFLVVFIFIYYYFFHFLVVKLHYFHNE